MAEPAARRAEVIGALWVHAKCGDAVAFRRVYDDALAQAVQGENERCIKLVPTNWCDSLLQRKGKALTDTWNAQDVEQLLLRLAAALRA